MLDREFAFFFSPDSDRLVDGGDEDFAVSDFACPRGLDDAANGGLDLVSGSTSSILILGRKSTVYSLPR